MTIPKAVIFDLGKVLLEFDYRIAIDRLAKRSPSTPKELETLLLRSALLLPYETGDLSSLELFTKVKESSGFRGDFDEFKEIFGDIFAPIPQMIQLNTDLRRRQVPTYIFSNTNELSIAFIRSHFPFFREFDGHILSYEHHAMKPDGKLYEVVEKFSGRHGDDLLFLDDRPEHIATAVRRGWQAHVHESPEKSRAIVAQTGLLG
jgi:HAD superfamily hydrolase (TIGR01509 family)